MCTGETEVLGVNVTGGTAPYTQYLWNNGTTLSSTTSPTPTSSATITTNYTVQVTDQNGCVGSGIVPLTVNPLPTVSAGPDIQLCNQPIPTNLTGYSPTTGGTGVWTGNNVTSAGVYTPNGVACDNLTYTFTSAATGCVNSDVVQVCVINPVAANGGPDFDICLNQPAIALPAGGTWTGTNVVANSFTPSTIGNTTLTFTVGSGSCQTTDQVVVTVNPLPTSNAGPDQTICAGVTVNLSGSGSSPNGALQTTTWSSACGGITNSLTLTPTVTPASSCTYNLTIVDTEGCSAQDQVTITVNPLPTVAAGPDLSLCNQPIATTLTGFSPAGGVWTAVPGITLAGNQVTPQGNGSFVLTYTYTSPTTNCVNSDNITVNVNSPVNADAGPDLDICLNAPAYSIVPPVAGGGWGPVGTVTAGGTFTPSSVGSFTLTYTVGAGTCQTSDQMTIVVNPLPTVDAGPNVSICLTDTVQLSAIISSGTAPYSPISWNFPATLSNPNIANPLAHPSVTTNYTINVTDAEGCQASDQVMVTVNSLPVVNAGPDLILCDQPIAEQLTGFSPTVGGVGTWTGTGITNANGTFQSPGVGTYWLYYEFTAGGNACANTDSIQVVVNAPVIANAGPDLTLCLNDAQVQFTGITPAVGGTWSGTGVTNTTSGIFNLPQQMQAKYANRWPAVQAPPPVYYLWSWGQNVEGALGLGNTTIRSSPNQVGALTTWTQIAGAWRSSLALKSDNTMWSWGRNYAGQLGLGDSVNKSSPVQVGSDTNWAKISAGLNHRLAVKSTGSIWAWGKNGYGELGISFTNSGEVIPAQIGALTNWANVDAGGYHSVSTKTDGTLWTWGYGSDGALGLGNTTAYSSPKQVGALTTWSDVAAGYQFNVAIKTDGTLWSWGINSSGRLGDGSTVSKSSPVQIGALTTWSKITASRESGFAIKSDGTLWAWGRNNEGTLGLGDTTNRSSPAQVGALTNWSAINGAVWGYHVAALKTDGTIWTWGYGAQGQLGLGNTTYYSSPKQVGTSTNWLRVAAGGYHTLGIG
jgi:alpha-tubulin suppressor-like RCC1 family protein